MTIHVLVEGPSERAFLERWAPRLLRGVPIRVHPHQGKGALPTNLEQPPPRERRGLLDQLPATLRGFAAALDSEEDGVLVLLDADDDDPDRLLATIAAAAVQVAPSLRQGVVLAVEETEAFYFGDLRALEGAFPDADMSLAREYVQDSICGTWELFGRVVRDGGGNKVAWAEAMGPRMSTRPARNRSPSFGRLVASLHELLPAPPKQRRGRPFRHLPKLRTDPGRRR